MAKRAERAQDRGKFVEARELYLKAVAKFKDAAEMSENFNETSVLRSLATYYNNCVHSLEKELDIEPPIFVPREKETVSFNLSEILKGTRIMENVFETVLKIALEICTEGREGRPIGTGFILGDSENVMAKSRQLVLNPFEGHNREKRQIFDQSIQDNIKEFAQLDGVFVISTDGVVEAAGRYITLDTGIVKMQRGLGTRHSSVAAITNATDTIGIVVSQGRVIRIIKSGKIIATVRP
ncbi:MAG: diadenylate cyclase [Candidatus Methanoperedens sp.]|nr:diadenylate cyclase [Candidatus Methanoperedens sp.]MCE8427588.1 diadenylate cyclase [Candidatus Methanoperedens sp.]